MHGQAYLLLKPGHSTHFRVAAEIGKRALVAKRGWEAPVRRQRGGTHRRESLEKAKKWTAAEWPFSSKARTTSWKSLFFPKHTSQTFTSGVKPQEATNLPHNQVPLQLHFKGISFLPTR